MEAFPNLTASLRDWIYRLRRRYRSAPVKTPVYLEGLPHGIERDLLASIIKEQFNRQIQSVRYTHLSGWKSSGAYRLSITPTTGVDIYLIFKLANYDFSEIPALRAFPLHPGLPEYHIYSQPAGPLGQYLPRVFLAEEIQPRSTYRYLLEDLSLSCQIARTDDQRVAAAGLLPELHAALAGWNEQADAQGLLLYGWPFSEKLQGYVRSSLDRYAQHHESPTLSAVLNQWNAIAQIHLLPEFFSLPLKVIHGDANFSNFHINRTDPRQFKIVDWEWAGFGTPFADLSALTKSSYPQLEKRGFDRFIQSNTAGTSEAQQWRLFLWTRLERAMIDAGFLSAQVLDAPRATRVDLPRAVDLSLERILVTYRQLAN